MKARRGRGEGSVYYDERREEWVGAVSLGVDPTTGKRLRRTIYAASKKEAQQRLGDVRSNSASELSRKREPTLLDFTEHWLQNEVRPNRRATTYRSYRGITSRHILPTIGSVRVNRLAPTDVQRCISRVHETTGPSMAGKARTILHRIMERACALEKASRNPVHHIEAPRVEKHEIEPLTVAQCTSLFKAASGDRFEALPTLLVLTGLRSGEARALKWADVDFDGKVIRVTKTVQEVKGPLVLVPTKTAAGKREVPLSALVAKALRKRERLARSEGFASDEDLIFPTTTGTLFRGSNLHRRWWAPLLVKAGLEGVRIHDLRHSAATLSRLVGTDAKIVAELLGHTDPAFTMRTYQHPVASLRHENAAAVDRLFAPKPKPKAKRK